VVAVPGNGSVAVSWTAPVSDGGSAITGYTVSASPGGKTCTALPAETGCTVSGLTNGTAYTFTVTAANLLGSTSSQPSARSTPVAHQEPQPAPSDASAPALPELTLELSLNLGVGVVPAGAPGAGGKAPDPRGAEVTVSGSGLMPLSDVVIELHSTPVHLATVKTDARGAFTVKLRLPKDITPGLHHVIATGTAPDGSAKVVSAGLVVPFPSLPYTGFNPVSLVALAAALVVVGALLIGMRPRQMPRRH
jgi:hypothetical protein